MPTAGGVQTEKQGGEGAPAHRGNCGQAGSGGMQEGAGVIKVYQGHVLEQLKRIAPGTFHTCITSPPY
jgi:hypothetical protein